MTDQLTTSVPGSLEARLGHRFGDPSLLDLALRHRSWCAEHAAAESNERLEFLGDAVLSLVVTTHLYTRFPELPEGELAKIRAAVVSADALAVAARGLELGPTLLLGRGEEATGGRDKQSILADTCEAVLGAVYLDGGIDPARRLILGILGPAIEQAATGPGDTDYKTRLQEHVAAVGADVPRYEVVDDGPDHAKTFHATVHASGVAGRGVGRSKKHAEQAAARAAWLQLGEHPDRSTNDA